MQMMLKTYDLLVSEIVEIDRCLEQAATEHDYSWEAELAYERELLNDELEALA